jgi:copper chaperone NosL
MSARVPSLFVGLAMVSALLVGCDEDTVVPSPQALTRDAIGHYCNMIVADHLGPKGQIILKSHADPLWFSSARDAIAFTMLPGEAKDIAAIYVTDMARANWDSPEPDTWIEARAAWYVIDSTRVGGMGAPEAVPFSTKGTADAFAFDYGGTVVAFENVPEDFVLGGVDVSATGGGHDG